MINKIFTTFIIVFALLIFFSSLLYIKNIIESFIIYTKQEEQIEPNNSKEEIDLNSRYN